MGRVCDHLYELQSSQSVSMAPTDILNQVFNDPSKIGELVIRNERGVALNRTLLKSNVHPISLKKMGKNHENPHIFPFSGKKKSAKNMVSSAEGYTYSVLHIPVDGSVSANEWMEKTEEFHCESIVNDELMVRGIFETAVIDLREIQSDSY